MEKRINKQYEAGFTLIEALVAGVVSVIIAVVMITIMNVFNAEVKEGTLRAKIQMDYDIVSQQIGSIVRVSQFVLANGETPSQVAVDTTLVLDTAISIHLALQNGIDTIAYQISSNVLQEKKKGATSFQDFKIGSRSITLLPGSGFILLPGRRSVKLMLNLTQTYKNKCDTLIVRGDRYLCRN